MFRVVPREDRTHIDRIGAGGYRNARHGAPNQLIVPVYGEEHLSLGVENELPAAGAFCARASNAGHVAAARTTAKSKRRIPEERPLALFIEIESIRFRILFLHDNGRCAGLSSNLLFVILSSLSS